MDRPIEHKKKILYVITKSNWGGAQRYVFDLASNLPKNGFEVIVASGGEGELIEKLRIAGIRTADIPAFQRDIDIFKEFKALWQLWRLFRREKPDVVHLNSSKAGGIGALAVFLYKLSTFNFRSLTIFTAHGWGFNEPRPEWQKFLIKSMTLLAAIFQDKIITICNTDFASARNFIPSGKLALIPNGINIPEFLPRDDARALLKKITGKNFQPDVFLIGTIAELTGNKGLTHLIDAIYQIKSQFPISNFQTIIIGDGEDRRKLQGKIDSHKLADTIFLAGSIPDASRLLKAFDVFVLPSLKEGLPYTLLEAMASGIPVIASSVGGIPDIIKNKETGLLVPPADASGLKNAIRELRDDKTLAARLGQNASGTVKTKFTLTAMMDKTIKLYAL